MGTQVSLVLLPISKLQHGATKQNHTQSFERTLPNLVSFFKIKFPKLVNQFITFIFVITISKSLN